MTLAELREFVDSLNTLRIGSGFTVVAVRDKNDLVGITGHFSDGMVSFKTGMIVFQLDEPSIPIELRKDRIKERLKKEFLACWENKWEMAMNADKYSNDGSSMEVVEDLSSEGVMRI